VLEKAVGHQLADIPMMIAGMDPCFSCNDRLVTVIRPYEQHTWTWGELREYGIEYYQSSKNKGEDQSSKNKGEDQSSKNKIEYTHSTNMSED
jgi:hypothetical protein